MTRRSLLDWIFGACGACMGLASLTFPYGRDQALYDYVARAWVLRGEIPYKDVFDHKTPGLYFLYALATRVFGPTTWGIRIIDLIGVVAAGVVAAAVVRPRGEPIPAGLRGLGVLITSVLFYGFLNYWDTAQSEIHYAALGVASVWAVRRIEAERRAGLVSGAFAGAALVMKPTSMWFAVVALVLLYRRVPANTPRLSRAVRAARWFVCGGAISIAPVVLYFGVHGALPALYDIAFKANSYYASHETNVQHTTTIPLRIWEYLAYYNPISTFGIAGLLIAVAFARAKKDAAMFERHALAAALCLAAFLAVFMQLKFYLLHWTAMIVPVTVVFLNLALDAELVVKALGLRRPMLASALAFVALYVMSESRVRAWYARNENAVLHLTGRLSEDEYESFFDFPGYFSYRDSVLVAKWIDERTTPSDFIAVRGFEPQIYLLANRRYPARFFWTTFFVLEQRESSTRRAVWAKEDLATLTAHPPKFVVAQTKRTTGPDSVAYFEPLGYKTQLVVNDFTILGRDAAAITP